MVSSLDTAPADRAALERLAVERPRLALPLLARAGCMESLVVVLAFLPGLYAVGDRTLTDAAALQSLHVLQLAREDRVFDRAAEQVSPAVRGAIAWQPPMAAWLSAVVVGVLGSSNPAAFVVVPYLSAAGVVLALYLLARRLGGHALGLAATALWAFNPHALALAQEPHLRPLACAFALLAFTGIVAHWQKVGSLVSLQLLLSGLALGTCLLSGGPLALAVILVLVIYVLLWKADAWWRARRGEDGVRERSRQGRKVALGTVTTLAATAFALGGWWLLLMSSRHGAPFWRIWFGLSDDGPAASGSPAWVIELASLSLPTLGLALLGGAVTMREIAAAREDPGRRHRGLVVVWVIVAFVLWLRVGHSARPGLVTAELWQTFLAIPLALLGGYGLLAVAERISGFGPAVAACAVSLVVPLLAALAELGMAPSRPAPLMLLPPWAAAPWALAAAGCAVAALRVPAVVDAPRRRILQAMLALLLAANVSWGLAAMRRAAPHDAELTILRNDLAAFPEARLVSLVAGGKAGKRAPPPALLLALACNWPGATSLDVTTWEELLASRSAPGRSGGNQVIVAWSETGRASPRLPGGTLRPIGAPFRYRSGEVAAYAWHEALP